MRIKTTIILTRAIIGFQ